MTPKSLRLQADCWAGAWTGDASARGFLEVSDPEAAVRQVVRLYEAPGTWFDAERYGSPERRTAAFRIGLENGPPGCASEEFFDV